MAYQPCNVEKPNSKDNTVVFSLFEAKDYRCKLRFALAKCKEQIDTLQSLQWE